MDSKASLIACPCLLVAPLVHSEDAQIVISVGGSAFIANFKLEVETSAVAGVSFRYFPLFLSESPKVTIDLCGARFVVKLQIDTHLWVPTTCVTWADALRIAVGRFRVRALGGQVLVGPEVG